MNFISVTYWFYNILLMYAHELLCSGGLRLKRDITEYGDFLRSFNAPSVDEKFELLGM